MLHLIKMQYNIPTNIARGKTIEIKMKGILFKSE